MILFSSDASAETGYSEPQAGETPALRLDPGLSCRPPYVSTRALVSPALRLTNIYGNEAIGQQFVGRYPVDET